MSSFVLMHPWALGLLPVLPGVHWLFRRADRKRADAARKFSPAHSGVTPNARLRFAVLLALGLTGVAIAQPVWRETESLKPVSGLDVVFLLDVSRSMLTRDGARSRIDQARAAIRDVVNHADVQRLALIVFAGNSSVECPLTSDYEFLLGQLKRASRESVTLGGSRPGDAIRFAARTAFDDASGDARELVLLSDGGDEGSAPDGAASELEKHHIHLVVAGVGDAAAAGFVPNSEADPTPILYRGKPVTAQRDDATLRRVCGASANCVFTTLPDAVFGKTVLDRRPGPGDAGANAASMGGSLFALVAAVLLAGECLLRKLRGQ